MVVGHQWRAVAIDFTVHGLDVFDIHRRQHGIGMGMSDTTKRQSGVQQCFNRRPRRRVAHEAAIKRPHHIRIAERFLLQEACHAGEMQGRECVSTDLRQIAAGAFDIEHACPVLIHFDRRIAAAMQHQRCVAAQQPRAIGVERKCAAASHGVNIVPQTVHALIIIGVMVNENSFTVRRADWTMDGVPLAAVRRAVFVVEQQVPEAEEWDDKDALCQHVIALATDDSAIGTGRLLPDGYIGRMAVLQPWRRRGVGSALLALLNAIARERGFAETRLHAQTHALAFYRKHGYVPLGAEFMEAGIPHYEMRLPLTV